METDKTTLNDLSIFYNEEEFSVFHRLNFTRTVGGREQLYYNFSAALPGIEAIRDVQQTIIRIQQKIQQWPMMISNGTIMVVEKFYESTLDEIPSNPTTFSAYSYKIFHAPDFSLVKYSVGHCF